MPRPVPQRRVDAREQVLGRGVPGPPQVRRRGGQGRQRAGRTVRTVNRRIALTRSTLGGVSGGRAGRTGVTRVASVSRLVHPARHLVTSVRCEAMPPRSRTSTSSPDTDDTCRPILRRTSAPAATPSPGVQGDRGTAPRPSRCGRRAPVATRSRTCPLSSRSARVRSRPSSARPSPSPPPCSARGTTRWPPPPSCTAPRAADRDADAPVRRPAAAAGRPTSPRRATGHWSYRSRRGATRSRPGATAPRSRCPPASTSSSSFAEGALLLERRRGRSRAASRATPSSGRRRRSTTSSALAPARLAVALDPAVDRPARGPRCASLSRRRPRSRLYVERERALAGAWYELFPRSEGASARPAQVTARSHGVGAAAGGGGDGLRRRLPAADPSDRHAPPARARTTP